MAGIVCNVCGKLRIYIQENSDILFTVNFLLACYISRAERKLRKSSVIEVVAKKRKREIEAKIDSKMEEIQRKIYKNFNVQIVDVLKQKIPDNKIVANEELDPKEPNDKKPCFSGILLFIQLQVQFYQLNYFLS